MEHDSTYIPSGTEKYLAKLKRQQPTCHECADWKKYIYFFQLNSFIDWYFLATQTEVWRLMRLTKLLFSVTLISSLDRLMCPIVSLSQTVCFRFGSEWLLSMTLWPWLGFSLFFLPYIVVVTWTARAQTPLRTTVLYFTCSPRGRCSHLDVHSL